jgi:hypothetical protein
MGLYRVEERGNTTPSSCSDVDPTGQAMDESQNDPLGCVVDMDEVMRRLWITKDEWPTQITTLELT